MRTVSLRHTRCIDIVLMAFVKQLPMRVGGDQINGTICIPARQLVDLVDSRPLASQAQQVYWQGLRRPN